VWWMARRVDDVVFVDKALIVCTNVYRRQKVQTYGGAHQLTVEDHDGLLSLAF
jgi:predicted RNA methylase